jgi:hypothetical protein
MRVRDRKGFRFQPFPRLRVALGDRLEVLALALAVDDFRERALVLYEAFELFAGPGKKFSLSRANRRTCSQM